MSFKSAVVDLWYKTLGSGATGATANQTGSLAQQVRFIGDKTIELDTDIAAGITSTATTINTARDAVNARIGTSGDSTDALTLYGRIALLNSKVGDTFDLGGINSLFGRTIDLRTRIGGVNTKIGLAADADTAQTVFGKIAAVQTAVDAVAVATGADTDLSSITAPLARIEADIGDPTDASTANTLFGRLAGGGGGGGTVTGGFSAADRARVGTPADSGDTIFSLLEALPTSSGGQITGGFTAADRTRVGTPADAGDTLFSLLEALPTSTSVTFSQAQITSLANQLAGSVVNLTPLTTLVSGVDSKVDDLRDDIGRNWTPALLTRIGVPTIGDSIASILRRIEADTTALQTAGTGGFTATDRTNLNYVRQQLTLTS